MNLDRASILAVADSQTKPLDIPEWGGTVFVRTLTGAERDKFEVDIQGKKREKIRAVLASLVLCDEAGTRLFTEADIDALSAKSGNALTRIFEAASEQNALTKRDVEALEKN